MKIFKFGGASVKDAASVRNVVSVLNRFEQEFIFVVISAMGKTTNAMEQLVAHYWNHDLESYRNVVQERRDFHYNILNELFEQKHHPVFNEVQHIFDQLEQKAKRPVSDNYDFEYDQIVSLGEILSTKIIAAYIKNSGIQSKWYDARKLIQTDHTYRAAKVNWSRTQELIESKIDKEQYTISILQGFIGHTAEGFSTTLGREGSDFTAAILAHVTQAEHVTIWKDVPGMLNADPKYFKDTVKLDQISYREAIELAYFGASVIHPKTIKPLQNKNIPLYVKSFLDPDSSGTKIHQDATYDADVPSYIFKMNQILVSITPKDFSFIVEDNLSAIFNVFALEKIKVNVMQNSAINFSVAIDHTDRITEIMLEKLSKDYDVKFNESLELVTVRHYDEFTIEKITKGKKILLDQRSRHTARLVLQ